MSASAVRLSALASQIGAPDPLVVGPDAMVNDVFHDSRDVVPGSAFVAIRGANVDGHDLIGEACAAGASAVVVEVRAETTCSQLIVDDTRSRMAEIAAIVHGHPSSLMNMVGVTGTNGKTTVTHMLESIVTAAGGVAGIVGTVGAHIAGEVVPLARTTPEATDLHRLLRRMANRGVTTVAMEVSSHALVLGRADALIFDVAVFTNLSQDHLDFHETMDDYFAAKASLFTGDRARHAVLWVDDPAGNRIAADTELAATTVGFGGAGSQDVSGEVHALSPGECDLTIHFRSGPRRIALPIAGRFNAANALLAAAAAEHLSIDVDAIVAGLETLPPIPGRFEPVPNNLGLTVIVDYAHTPAAVATSIATAAEVARGRVVAVAGSAGDRDADKRRPMGEAAATAGLAIITSDNPRSEDPMQLVEEVLVGAGGRSEFVVAEVDRRSAIKLAIAKATPADIVLILGKGHETYQEFAGHTIDFDDRLVAAEEMAALEQSR